MNYPQVFLAFGIFIMMSSRVTLAFRSQPLRNWTTGIVTYCSAETPCPQSYECTVDRSVPTVRACFRYGSFSSTRPQGASARKGVCPSTINSSNRNQFVFSGIPCLSDNQCPPALKCCGTQSMFGVRRACLRAGPEAQRPVVTVLDEGVMDVFDGGFKFVASITLVQNKGKNFLVDTGTTTQLPSLVSALQKQGISLNDIDTIVTTHGHPDHISNLGAMPDTPSIFDAFTVKGTTFTFNAFAQGKKLYLGDGDEIEVIQTPGHTLQDVSVVVRNTTEGTIVVVGDLILNENDAQNITNGGSMENATAGIANRKRVVCIADHIVPGHGKMFKVHASLKAKAECGTDENKEDSKREAAAISSTSTTTPSNKPSPGSSSQSPRSPADGSSVEDRGSKNGEPITSSVKTTTVVLE